MQAIQKPQYTYNSDTEPKPQPLKKFQAGAVTATIWENKDHQDPTKTYKTVSFDRNYKDKQGNWKKANSLRTTDLPKAVIVLKKAYEFLVLKNYTENSSIQPQ